MKARSRVPLTAMAVGTTLVFSGILAAGEPGSKANEPTFAKDVAPILQSKCEERHHQGTAAPMSLTT
jgi:hypothetical protein